jgi:hypothetical protein
MGGRIKVLATIQGFVGVTAVAGGALLAAAPSGRYLAGDPAVLVHTPFHDFFVPGVLLAVFVGGGGLLAAALTWSRGLFWQPYAILYALGLIVFEVVEYLLIGFQFLQAFELALALITLLLKTRLQVGLREPGSCAASASGRRSLWPSSTVPGTSDLPRRSFSSFPGT